MHACDDWYSVHRQSWHGIDDMNSRNLQKWWRCVWIVQIEWRCMWKWGALALNHKIRMFFLFFPFIFQILIIVNRCNSDQTTNPWSLYSELLRTRGGFFLHPNSWKLRRWLLWCQPFGNYIFVIGRCLLRKIRCFIFSIEHRPIWMNEWKFCRKWEQLHSDYRELSKVTKKLHSDYHDKILKRNIKN